MCKQFRPYRLLSTHNVQENNPDLITQKVNLAEECKSGKHVIMGVPGAFTPTCSKTHLPGYVAKAEELKAQGVGQIFCVSVNDPFVMAAWGENQGAEGKVRMLADTCGEFTKVCSKQTQAIKY